MVRVSSMRGMHKSEGVMYIEVPKYGDFREENDWSLDDYFIENYS